MLAIFKVVARFLGSAISTMTAKIPKSVSNLDVTYASVLTPAVNSSVVQMLSASRTVIEPHASAPMVILEIPATLNWAVSEHKYHSSTKSANRILIVNQIKLAPSLLVVVISAAMHAIQLHAVPTNIVSWTNTVTPFASARMDSHGILFHLDVKSLLYPIAHQTMTARKLQLANLTFLESGDAHPFAQSSSVQQIQFVLLPNIREAANAYLVLLEIQKIVTVVFPNELTNAPVAQRAPNQRNVSKILK